MTQSSAQPSVETQRDFWDGWNGQCRVGDKVEYQRRQAGVAVSLARRLRHRAGRPLRILDAGCGTGWLAAELDAFGEPHGFDLSSAAVEYGRAHFPSVALRTGTFDTLRHQLGEFDMVVSADVLAHVPDQAAYVRDVANVLRPSSTFLLMTQNPYVWNRTSYLGPPGNGQIRDWPSRNRIHDLLGEHFEIEHFRTIDPGGDRGLLWLTGNWLTRKVRHVPGVGPLWTGTLERVGIGRDFVVVARKR